MSDVKKVVSAEIVNGRTICTLEDGSKVDTTDMPKIQLEQETVPDETVAEAAQRGFKGP